MAVDTVNTKLSNWYFCGFHDYCLKLLVITIARFENQLVILMGQKGKAAVRAGWRGWLRVQGFPHYIIFNKGG